MMAGMFFIGWGAGAVLDIVGVGRHSVSIRPVWIVWGGPMGVTVMWNPRTSYRGAPSSGVWVRHSVWNSAIHRANSLLWPVRGHLWRRVGGRLCNRIVSQEGIEQQRIIKQRRLQRREFLVEMWVQSRAKKSCSRTQKSGPKGEVIISVVQCRRPGWNTG